MSNYTVLLQADTLIKIILLSMVAISLGMTQSACVGQVIKLESTDFEADHGDKVTEGYKNKVSRSEGEYSVDDNPHWDKAKCNICHVSAVKPGESGLRGGETEESCIACHAEDVIHKYIHPVGIGLSAPFKARIKDNWNDELPVSDKSMLTCLTCHDLLNQCLPKRAYMKNINPGFLRDGPYSKRTDICYKCHDSSKYERLNSHEQIAKDGTLRLNKCRICHVVRDIGKVKNGIERNMSQYPLIKGLDNDRKLLCVRCHKKVDHPTSAFRVSSTKMYRHLVNITEEKKKTLDAMKSKTGVIMPLEPGTDRIYCGTCHEAHQPGVFSGELSTSMKGTNNRLRENDICTYCHDK